MKILNDKISNVLTFVLGAVFVFSGVVKGIDPYGTALKIKEYFNLFHLSAYDDASGILSVLLCAAEIFLGLMLVFRLFRKTAIAMLLIVMSVFTVITAVIAFDPYSYIEDCGCFGDAVHFSQTGTFVKNIVILIAVIYSFCAVLSHKATVEKIHKKRNIFLSLYFVVGALALPVYSAAYLPPADFLGYNIGTDLLNKKEFYIADENGRFVKDSLLNNTGYDFIIINRKPLTMKEKENLVSVCNFSNREGINFFVLRSYGNKGEKGSKEKEYFADDVTLKSVIRDRNGALLVNGGIIKGKWNLRHSIIRNANAETVSRLVRCQKNKFPLYIFIAVLYIAVPLFYLGFNRPRRP